MDNVDFKVRSIQNFVFISSLNFALNHYLGIESVFNQIQTNDLLENLLWNLLFHSSSLHYRCCKLGCLEYFTILNILLGYFINILEEEAWLDNLYNKCVNFYNRFRSNFATVLDLSVLQQNRKLQHFRYFNTCCLNVGDRNVTWLLGRNFLKISVWPP